MNAVTVTTTPNPTLRIFGGTSSSFVTVSIGHRKPEATVSKSLEDTLALARAICKRVWTRSLNPRIFRVSERSRDPRERKLKGLAGTSFKVSAPSSTCE